MRVKCLAQEHNTMSPARARTRSARSGVERTNHEATAPPQNVSKHEAKIVKRLLKTINSVHFHMPCLVVMNFQL